MWQRDNEESPGLSGTGKPKAGDQLLYVFRHNSDGAGGGGVLCEPVWPSGKALGR